MNKKEETAFNQKVEELSKLLTKNKEQETLQKKQAEIQKQYVTSNQSTYYSSTTDGTFPSYTTGTPISPNYYPGVQNPHAHGPGGVTGHRISEHQIPQRLTVEIDSEELSDLVEMLEVEPGGDGLLLSIRGVEYSLINILKAQTEMMMRLNIFLMHRLMPDDKQAE